jgi:hypothetical protein
MHKTLIAAALGALLAAPTLATAAGNLIDNGSFEATSQASGSWAVYATLPGWTTVAGSGIELRNNVAGTAYDGVNFVELDAYSNSAMQQTLATQAGQLYDLSFAYSARPGVADSKTNGIAVAWNGVTLMTVTGKGGAQHNWLEIGDLQVLGTGHDRLTFSAIGISDSLGGSLDAVSLTAAVPEPGTYALMLAGLLGVGFIARRRA